MPKPSFQGSNSNRVKQHNLQVVLLSLLHEGKLSRVQLAQKTNLSNTTITNLIAELIEQGIVTEVDEGDARPDEFRPVGRPRTNIQIEPNARYVIGIHIGVGLFRVGITNICNELLHNQVVYFDKGLPAAQVLAKMVETVEAVLQASGVAREKILGVGVGASGLVDFQSGVNLVAPNLNWHNIPLREFFQQAFNLPVVVDNNVRTMALAETYFGAGRGVGSLAFVYGRTGVGAGLIFKGEVFRGSTQGAGEIGHTVILLRGGELCRCGQRGCLETLISEEAILRQADQIAAVNPQGIMAQTLADENDISPIERVFRAARSGDTIVQAMLEDRAYYLGVALSSMVNLFNPQLIFLGGIFSRGQDFFLKPVIRTVNEMSFGGLGQQVRIEPTSFGWKAGVLGASTLALLTFFYQPE